MQVFVPLADSFESNARILDRYRLNSQMREVLILLNGGWQNHPASKAWRESKDGLSLYAYAVLEELEIRGIRTEYYRDRLRLVSGLKENLDLTLPSWWGDNRIHDSHKARLLQKSEFYHQYGWQEYIKDWQLINYQWPILNGLKEYSLYQTKLFPEPANRRNVTR